MARAAILSLATDSHGEDNMSDLIDPRHGEVRSFLRVLGPAVAGAGLLFTIIGIGSFFAAFGGFGPPRLFWCAFVGLPLLAVGVGITKFAYLGSVARYIASEAAPVGKDMTNYLVEGTRDSIRDVASAIGEGFAGARAPSVMPCQKCGTENDDSANFCRQCGSPLAKTKHCPKCGEANDADARFCDNCGTSVA
jgi:ribosomal protein L40E